MTIKIGCMMTNTRKIYGVQVIHISGNRDLSFIFDSKDYETVFCSDDPIELIMDIVNEQYNFVRVKFTVSKVERE